MRKNRHVTFLLIVGFLIPVVTGWGPAAGGASARTTASPDAVVAWSTKTAAAVVDEGGYSPPEAAVLVGIAHVAIYDAAVAIEGGSRPYAVRPRAPRGASPVAAVAAAAHGTLVGLLPDQQASLDADYATYLATMPSGRPTADGIAVGEAVARGILALRANDGRNDVVPYVQAPAGPGVYEPTAPFPPVLTHLPAVMPLVLPRADLFRVSGPPALTSGRYARDLNEVAARGRLGAPRSPAEIATLRLWADHGVLQWNRALLRLIGERHLNLVEAARLLAMAHASGGDAMIACFDAKYHYRFWRPVHAIRRADTDGNAATASDPTWAPQIPTPNHPEYTAAHNCHSAAIAGAIGAFFDTDRVAITIDSMATGEVRRFDRLSYAVADVVEARILAGVHFRSSAEDGTTLGAKVARFVTRTHFTSRET